MTAGGGTASGAVLVTGGSSGIGAAAATAAHDAGHRVGVVCRPGSSPPAGTDRIEADLADAAATTEAVQRWQNGLALPPAALVLSAVTYGPGTRHAVVESSLEAWDAIMAVNLRAQYVVTSAVLPGLLSRPSAVILSISSVAAVEPAPGRAAYAASKAGTYAFFRALAHELRDTGVAVVQAMPANQVVTPGLRARRPPEFPFTGYDSPDIFRPLVQELLATSGKGVDGALVTVDGDGGWRSSTI